MELIPVENLLYMLLPLSVVGYLYYEWINDAKEVLYVTARMVVQLLLIGYFLVFIFQNDSWIIGFFIIFFMIIMSSFIVMRNIKYKDKITFLTIFFAIAVGGTLNLVLIIKFVLELTSFYEPRYVIPLAGMIYANAMNAVSLAAERYESDSKEVAFKSSMIPKVNAFLAVGLVSLPGMMTGQILSGVDPLVAVRYQIVVMAMIFSSAGISVAIYLSIMEKYKKRV